MGAQAFVVKRPENSPFRAGIEMVVVHATGAADAWLGVNDAIAKNWPGTTWDILDYTVTRRGSGTGASFDAVTVSALVKYVPPGSD